MSDRATLCDLTGLNLPLRPGGALDETYEQALAAIGAWSEDDEEEESGRD